MDDASAIRGLSDRSRYRKSRRIDNDSKKSSSADMVQLVCWLARWKRFKTIGDNMYVFSGRLRSAMFPALANTLLIVAPAVAL